MTKIKDNHLQCIKYKKQESSYALKKTNDGSSLKLSLHYISSVIAATKLSVEAE